MDTTGVGLREPGLAGRRVRIPAEVWFEGGLSPAVKVTLAQVASLAEDAEMSGGGGRRCTPPMTLAGLGELTGRCPATLRVHLAVLRAYKGVVRLERQGPGLFRLALADWLFGPLPGAAGDQVDGPLLRAADVPGSPARPDCGAVVPGGAEAGGPLAGRDPACSGGAAGRELPGGGGARPEGGGLDRAGGPGLVPQAIFQQAGAAAVPAPAAQDPINILINNTINQEEEAGPVHQTGKDLPPPPDLNNNNINNTGSPAPKTGAGKSGRRSKRARAAAGSPGAAEKGARVKPGGGSLSQEARAALEEAGVFSSLFGEVAGAGWSEAELLALAAWCRNDNPKKPGGLFMVRLRSGLTPPEVYFQPPCARCGGRGGEHSAECAHRYTSGPYASFIHT